MSTQNARIGTQITIGFDLKTILVWAFGLLAIVIGVFWFIAARENVKLRKQLVEATFHLIDAETALQGEIEKEDKEVAKKIITLDKEYQKAKTNEEEIIRNYRNLDADAAAIFITEYAARRRAETNGNSTVGGREPVNP